MRTLRPRLRGDIIDQPQISALLSSLQQGGFGGWGQGQGCSGWEFMEQRHSRRTRSGAKSRCRCWGRRGAGGTADKGRAVGPPVGAGLPGHGQGRCSWLRSGGPSLDLPTNGGTTALGRVTLGGRTAWEGSLFTESPGSKLCHWAGGCFLELWKEQEKHGVLGSLPNPEFAPRQTPPRGEAHGIWKTQCLPCCLPPGAAAAPPQPAYRVFPVPSGAFRGHDWGPSGLCVACSRGPLGHRSPCPLGVTARMERHRDGRWGRTNVVGRERHGLCLES